MEGSIDGYNNVPAMPQLVEGRKRKAGAGEGQMAGNVGTAVQSASLTRLWLAEVEKQTGPPVGCTDSQPDCSSESPTVSDADSLRICHLDMRKRKESSAGKWDINVVGLDCKRYRKGQKQWIVSSCDSTSCAASTSTVEGLGAEDALMIQKHYLAGLKLDVFGQQVRCVRAHGVPELDTSCSSCDGDGDGKTSGITSACTSSDGEDDSSEMQVTDLWTEKDDLLRSQFNVNIAKQRLKLDGSELEGRGAHSTIISEQPRHGRSHLGLSNLRRVYSAKGPVSPGAENVESKNRFVEARSAGYGETCSSFWEGEVSHLGSGSKQIETQGSLPSMSMFGPSHVGSVPQSCAREYQQLALDCCLEKSSSAAMVGTVKDEGEDGDRERKNESCQLSIEIPDQGAICGVRGPSFPLNNQPRIEEDDNMGSHAVHQTYVLSSGRLSRNKELQPGGQRTTIDCDFDEYFSKLML